ncbi:MAG: tRNA 4-thiouridine(8) synthase ThiI [Methanomassiliicoccales archaeon]|nr:tRNA 4-thiouridine(8) synthase ThiI [Methanomassiliicoccales archaeon]
MIALLSSGIDSPVAAFLMAERGAEMVLLHMDNRPFGSELGVRKTVMLAEALRRTTGQRMPLYMAPHGENQAINIEQCRSPYRCVLCKRLMLRTAQEVAIELGARGIVTGDSLGQVASQTLSNLRAEQYGLRLAVLRPLIGLDKLEIERMAREIGTYETSIISDGTKDCTAVPSRVITNASLSEVLAEEAKIDADSMAKRAAERAVRI